MARVVLAQALSQLARVLPALAQALRAPVLAHLRAVIQAVTGPSPPQASSSLTSRRRPPQPPTISRRRHPQRQATTPLTTPETSRRQHPTDLVTGPAQTTKGSYPPGKLKIFLALRH